MARVKPFKDKRVASAAGKKSRRGLSKKTILWNQLGGYITEAGAKKFLTEIKKLKGIEYIDKYLMTLEYFKPKMARTELVGDGGRPIKIIYEPAGRKRNKSKSN